MKPILFIIISQYILISFVNNGNATEDILTLINVGEKCDELLKEFSVLLPQFIQCSLFHARPFTVCENCIQSYTNITNIYQVIVSTKDNSSRSCEDVLLNVDRIQVVRKIYNGAVYLWEHSKCSNCYTRDYVLSNTTLTFNAYANDTLKCIEKARRANPESKHIPNGTVCQQCGSLYQKLNGFYTSLGESADLCMDVVDKMNATRILWSEHLHCVTHNTRITGVFLSATAMCCAPILFYFLAWWTATRQEQCIIPQKRLMQDMDQSTIPT